MKKNIRKKLASKQALNSTTHHHMHRPGRLWHPPANFSFRESFLIPKKSNFTALLLPLLLPIYSSFFFLLFIYLFIFKVMEKRERERERGDIN